jgi:hypothetical protein
MKFFGTLLILAFLAFGGFAYTATLVVGQDGWQPFTTIQSAINIAEDGDVIKVNPGVYKEQVVIRDLRYMVIQGDQATITVPTSGMKGQLVKVVKCEDIHITGFTIDGRNGVGVTAGASNGGGDADTRFYGIFLLNSSGHIVNNTVKDISWGNGAQQGLGIYVRIDDSVAREVNIRENIITNFQKNGITINKGPVQAKIHKNTVTGWGNTTIIAQNCIQVGGDTAMTASVTSNVVSKSRYTLDSWSAAGILVVFGSDNIRIVRNSASDCGVGIFVDRYYSDTYGYPLNINGKLINNSGSGNDVDLYTEMGDTKIHASKFED